MRGSRPNHARGQRKWEAIGSFFSASHPAHVKEVPEQDPKRVLQDIGRCVAEIRAKTGLTQERFAENVLGVSLKYLQRVEAGRENLTVESLVALANKVQARVALLFEEPANREVKRGRPPRRALAKG